MSKIRVGGSHPESPLQQARKRAGLRPADVAEAISLEVRTVQRYEAGEQSPTQETLKIMQKLYKCEIIDLFIDPFASSDPWQLTQDGGQYA